MTKNPRAMQETWFLSLGWDDLLEEGRATHSSILAWKILTEKPGRLQSMGLQRFGHDWAIKHSTRHRGFSGGSVVKKLAANAGHVGSIPGPGRFHKPQSSYAHTPQPLSLRSRAGEPQLLRPRFTARGATAMRSPRAKTRGQPQLATTRERPHRNGDPAEQEINKDSF